MRRVRFLPSNLRNTSPTRCVWVDTETTPSPIEPDLERHDLVFGWGHFARRHRRGNWSAGDWYRFESPHAFWEWVEGKCPERTALYLFAHNAAYDMTVLQCWDILPKLGWRLTGAILDSPPFIATWRKGRCVIKMIDSLNLWRKPLAVLGQVVGLPKLDMPETWTDKETADTYCRRDVAILRKMCLKWWGWLKEEDMGSAAVTLASQAMTTYRHRFMTHPIFLDNNERALTLARDGYHGGRVECFSVGTLPTPTYLLDVNSMYPFVMERESYPTKLAFWCRYVSTSEMERWLKKYCVVARVTVDTPEPCYPLRVPQYLLHPVGRFETVLTTPELTHALARGRVVSISEAAVYERAPIFRSYVREFYERRLSYKRDGDAFGSEVTKLMLNSLYGKFGQRGWVTDIRTPVEYTGVGAWTEIDLETGKTYRCRALAGVLVVEHQEGEAPYSHPAISAHVTGWGRMELWKLIEGAGMDQTLYCSTDSVLVTERGLERLYDARHADALGALRLERKVERGTLYGPNDYELDGERKTKGVSKKAIWTTPNTLEQEQWLGLKSLIMKGHLESPLVRHQTKTLKRIYHKGHVEEGGRTRPFSLPLEWDAWSGQNVTDGG